MKRLAQFGLIVAIAATIALLSERPLRSSTTTLSGTILDAQGNGVNGILTMQLPVPAQDTASNTAIANTIVRYKLVNGVIQSGPPLYDVAGLQPANLFYAAKVYDTAGNVVMAGNYVVTGGTFNLGAATPTSITTSNISFTNPASQGGNNTFTGTNNVTGPWTFSNGVTSSAYLSVSNCAQNTVSPAACGSAPAGVFAVPTTTTTYTINTTAVTSGSRILLQQITDNAGIPSSPTCVATVAAVQETGRVNGTSFAISLPSTTGVTCFNYWLVN